MAAHYPLWVLFLKYIIKHSVSSLLPPFTRTGLYNQSNIQFLKIAAACAIIFCLFFMANVWKALIATHFSLRLAFFQEFFSSSVSLAWQTKDFSPLGNKFVSRGLWMDFTNIGFDWWWWINFEKYVPHLIQSQHWGKISSFSE